MANPTIHQYLSLKIQSHLFPLLFSIFLYHFTTPIAGGSPSLYYAAVGNITLDCGSPNVGLAPDQRLWFADTNSSTLITLLDQPINSTTNSSTTSSAGQPSTSKNPVPYLTARLSLSRFTYLFSITPGQIFVRLHFYRTDSYKGFENYTPFFSVISNNVTLLSNFSASPTTGSDTLMKEFCINVPEGQRPVNITFTPSLAIPTAYAFINGIEIVSMPTNLYYTDTDGDQTEMIGTGGARYSLDSNRALELMYRVNVGGIGISPDSDTGMYRNWDMDYSYFSNNHPFALAGNVELNLHFSNIKNYTAPAMVYRTGRSMGPNKTINEHSNLTWIFPVDSGFAYFVRLHFCELISLYANYGSRVFYIFLATQIAERSADIVGWTGGHGIGIPMYKDYVVLIGNNKGSKETTKSDLMVQLHPAEEWRTMYSDAILNGVEIFKISNGLDQAGIHPYSPPTTTHSVSQPNTPPSTDNHSKFAIVGGVLASVVVLAFLALLILRQRKKLNKGKEAATSRDCRTSWGDRLASFTTTNKSTKTQNSNLPYGRCRYFSLSEIKAATNNFDEVFIIGVGGFGDVYKGFISSLSAEVAIKRLKQGSQQGN